MALLLIGATFFGEPAFLTVLTLAIGLLFLWRRRWGWFSNLAIATIGAVGFNFWLKTVFSRARPELWERIIDVGCYSFKSGHAMISPGGLRLVGLLARQSLSTLASPCSQPYRYGDRSYRFEPALFGRGPADVIAGFSAGLAWLVTCILSLEVGQKFPFVRRE